MFRKPLLPNLTNFPLLKTMSVCTFYGRSTRACIVKKIKKRRGKRRACYFSFAMVRIDLTDIITAAGAAKATMYDRMAEAQKYSRG
jgi:hypothetical protein